MLSKHSVLNLVLSLPFFLRRTLKPTTTDIGREERIPPGQLTSPSQLSAHAMFTDKQLQSALMLMGGNSGRCGYNGCSLMEKDSKSIIMQVKNAKQLNLHRTGGSGALRHGKTTAAFGHLLGRYHAATSDLYFLYLSPFGATVWILFF